jgi:type IX secretion system PorP/SprF family membrane protein
MLFFRKLLIEQLVESFFKIGINFEVVHLNQVMSRIRLIFCFLFCLLSTCLYAQDVTNFTQFFINPYSINPSYAGIEGRGALFFAYRKQWAGIDGAPSIVNATFHAPTKVGLNYGLSLANDARGLLKTTSVLLTGGYTVTIDKTKFIRFGISAGAASNAVNTAEFENPLYDQNDPVLTKLLAKNMYLIGNAGLSIHLKSFHMGASLPNIFTPAYISTEAFSVNEVKPFQALIIHASNRFYFAKDKHVFEPYLIYRMNKDLPGQIEAAGVLHLNHVLWVGGAYKQDFGISALGGIKLQNFLLIGGSYSLKNTGVNELGSPSFEIQLGYIFGAKQKEIPVYSFVNTVKEKERRKTPAQIAAEKHKQELAIAKKKEEQLAIKKQQEERKLELAKREEEAKKVTPPVTQETKPVVTQQETKPVVTQQETKPVVTQKETKPVVTQQEAKPVVTQQETKPVVTQETKPVDTQQETKPVVTQETKPVVTQQETKPVVTQETKPVVTQQETKPVVTQETKPVITQQQQTTVPKRHDGGPRLKTDILEIDLPTYDTAHHEEQARIARIEEHAADPNEHHGDEPDAHPNSERHEFVKRGSHAEELEVADYVIIGVFKTGSNASHFSDGLSKLGFSADYGHLTEKNLWYVYIAKANDIDTAKAERNKFRKLKIFRDAWLLTVHH